LTRKFSGPKLFTCGGFRQVLPACEGLWGVRLGRRIGQCVDTESCFSTLTFQETSQCDFSCSCWPWGHFCLCRLQIVLRITLPGTANIILMYSKAPLPPTFPRIYSLSPITRTFPRICTTSTHTATGKSTDTSTPVPTGILDIRKRTTGPTTPTELTGILHSSPVMGTRIRITDSGIRIRLIPDAEPALRSNLLKASLFSDRSYETKKSLPMSDRQGIAAAANLGSQPQGKPEHAARLLIRCLLDHLSWGDVLSQGRVPAASMGDRLIGRIPGPVVARRCRFDSCESIRVLSGTNPEK
jgi:hypothetical protein